MEQFDPFAPQPEAAHTRNTISSGSLAPVTRYTVSILVQNQPGVLSRVSGLCSRRGFNIDTLAVGTTQDEDVSRITITLRATPRAWTSSCSSSTSSSSCRRSSCSTRAIPWSASSCCARFARAWRSETR